MNSDGNGEQQGLYAYGLLIGEVKAVRPPRGTEGYLLLLVQPGQASHPAYRVAVNVQATGKAQIEYQVVDLQKVAAAAPLLADLRRRKATPQFVPAASDAAIKRIDYVRGASALGIKAFASAKGNSLLEAVSAVASVGATVAVYGTGSPMDHRTGKTSATGYTGIDNVHMNQGALHLVRGTRHFLENGPSQDGALILFTATSAKAIFIKFDTQLLETDAAGNPTVTNVAKIDATPAPVKKAIFAPAAAAPTTRIAKRTTAKRPTPPVQPAAAPARGQSSLPTTSTGFVFADPDDGDATEKWIPDDDDGTFNTPFVKQLGSGKTRGPVPSPARYPTMELASVVGAARPPGYTVDASGASIAFDIVGDSGAPAQAKRKGEIAVTDLLAATAKASPPAFLFHVGDIVYYYGEGPYYFGQFFEPFRAYPAPIFAIPGNHDAITYEGEGGSSLESFQHVFCAETPGRTALSGGIRRSTMTQPGVYFTLDAPLVSVIGLYSNCSESVGWLDQQQLLFLYNELVRLKALRQNDGRAVLLAIHHCPRWFPGQAKPDATSTAIDNACDQAGFWPDAVLCGHAHLYQRIVRQEGGRDIPYIISGAGGYAINPNQELAKKYVATLPSGLTQLIKEEGFVRATVTKPAAAGKSATLRLEYHSTKQTSAQAEDVCILDLKTNKLIQPLPT